MNRCCCNCGHCERREEGKHILTYCDLNNAYIGYADCFEGWCPHWKKERKWDHERSDTQSGTV